MCFVMHVGVLGVEGHMHVYGCLSLNHTTTAKLDFFYWLAAMLFAFGI